MQRPPALPKLSTAHANRAVAASAEESGEHATAYSSMPVPKGTIPHGASVSPPPLGRSLLGAEEREWELELARHKRSQDDEESEWQKLRERAREEEEREWRALRARVVEKQHDKQDEEQEWRALRERARQQEEREWSRLILEAKQRADVAAPAIDEECVWREQLARAKSGRHAKVVAPVVPAVLFPTGVSSAPKPTSAPASVYPFDAARSTRPASAPLRRVVAWP